jgi:membrane protein implicated in regulation of membrane protease activity
MWALLGLALLAGEMLTPGAFYFLFFGLSGLAVALVAWLGLVASAPGQWLLFSFVSIVCLVPLRGRLVRWMSGPDDRPHVDALVGELAVLLDDVPPGEFGKGELRGSAWNARNAGATPLRKGQRARVTRVDGLTLWLEENR